MAGCYPSAAVKPPLRRLAVPLAAILLVVAGLVSFALVSASPDSEGPGATAEVQPPVDNSAASNAEESVAPQAGAAADASDSSSTSPAAEPVVDTDDAEAQNQEAPSSAAAAGPAEIQPPAPVSPPSCDLVTERADAPVYGRDPRDPDNAIEVRRIDIMRDPCTGKTWVRDTRTGELAPTGTVATDGQHEESVPVSPPSCDLVVDEANDPVFGLDPRNPESGQWIEVNRIDVLRNPCTGELYTRDVDTGEISDVGQIGDDTPSTERRVGK